MNTKLYLSDEQYIEQLKKYRQRLVDGKIPLTMIDDDTPGNKWMETSWGLCNRDPSMWPLEMQLWPDNPKTTQEGQVYGVKYRQQHQKCPFDRRTVVQLDGNGCFYTCMLFGKQITNSNGHRSQAIALFDQRLAEVSDST